MATAIKPSTTTSQLVSCRLSATDVENCIRNAGPIFHILLPGSLAPSDSISFILRPPSIVDKDISTAFSLAVYEEWVKTRPSGDGGVTSLGLTYSNSTGSFTLDSCSSNLHLDRTRLRNALDCLAAVALQQAAKQHLTEGGDERLHLSSGGNKYFCPPHPIHGAIIRGTCTCSPPSQNAFDAACRRLHNIWNCVESFEDAFDDVRNRISTALGLQTPHHIILHPSGTDAEYTPLLIGANSAKTLGCSGVVNVIVGAGESLVDDFVEGTKVLQLKARTADASMVSDFDQLVLDAIEGALACSEKPFFIMHAVDGSKLGSHITGRGLVTNVQARFGDRVLVVLDACQGRTDREELDWYLSRGAVVLITASKFYSAPGFCGMAVVPDSAAELLKHGATIPPGLGQYLTKFQVPSSLKALRAGLPALPINVGLLLRWTCGVAEMERLARVGSGAREGIRRWVYAARDLIRRHYPDLQLVPESSSSSSQTSQLGGVNSIIAFKLLAGESKTPLKTMPLKQIHQWLTADVSNLLPATASMDERRAVSLRCFIGQPVDLGDFAVLRLAIGAALASELGDDPSVLDTALREDGMILDKVRILLKYYGEM
ncbi:pyridoxal phosphate-dependent transferase, major region, subdomain 1 [Cladorrhinum samala]|uniref:Pyridoxal phosphate-dependent transferase, major region, subdomain 1 n=1 Tax=Cladorrhinum samala TaxID=585594 RepID=A0AAV9HH51_9PEZI|nr:pyridoxal phosphate-dependent transferase, major region, subdomain 1 [Cladorrhinum samala]